MTSNLPSDAAENSPSDDANPIVRDARAADVTHNEQAVGDTEPVADAVPAAQDVLAEDDPESFGPPDNVAAGTPISDRGEPSRWTFRPIWEPLALEGDQEIRDAFALEAGQRALAGGIFRPKPYVESSASRALMRQLLRYVGRRYRLPESLSSDSGLREQASQEDAKRRARAFGRSVLISGLRGCGKTATVYWAIRDVQYQLLNERVPIRLLPVLISSASFLNDSASGQTGNRKPEGTMVETTGSPTPPQLSVETQSGTGEPVTIRASLSEAGKSNPVGTTASSASPQPLEDQPRYRMLIELCCGLHRAVQREFLRSIRERLIEDEAAGLPRRTEMAGFRIQDRYELLTQLQQDIEHPWEPSRLRDYWCRFGFLDRTRKRSALFNTGLFKKGGVNLVPTWQPIEEIGLLTSLNRLYLRTVGKLWSEEKTTDGGQQVRSDDRKPVFDPALWRPLIAGVLGGSAAGAGTASSQAGNLMTLLAMIAVGVGVGWLTSLFPTWKQERTQSRTEQFSKDYSLKTLHRDLGPVIDQMFQVGLCPVFIIDEMDKWPDLFGKMDGLDGLLSQLKQYFSEDGFFVFITHREFYEEMQRQELNDPFGSHSTWFTERLLVGYRGYELRRFIRDTIHVGDARDLPGTTRQIYSRARTILEYVLQFRSHSRMARLCWAMNDVQELVEQEELRLSDLAAGKLRRYLLEMTFALVAEVVFEELLHRNAWTEGLTDPASLSAAEHQLIQHVLSLPGRCWSSQRDLPDLSGAAPSASFQKEIAALRKELNDEIGTRPRPENLSPPKTRLLWECLRRTIELLVDSRKLISALAERRFFVALDVQLRDMLDVLKPVVRESESAPPVFRFYSDGTPTPQGREPDTQRHDDAPQVFVEKLQRLLNGGEVPQAGQWIAIARRFHLLERCGLAPPLPTIDEILGRDVSVSRDFTDSELADIQRLQQHLQNSEFATLLIRSLMLATAAGWFSNARNPGERLDSGLAAIVKWLPRQGIEFGPYRLMLENALSEVTFRQNALPVLTSGQDDVLRIGAEIVSAVEKVRPKESDRRISIRLAALAVRQELGERLQPQNRSEKRVVPSWALGAYILVDAAGWPVMRRFERDLREMTVRQWSEIVIDSLIELDSRTSDKSRWERMPLFCGVRALQWLNFLLDLLNAASIKIPNKLQEMDGEFMHAIGSDSASLPVSWRHQYRPEDAFIAELSAYHEAQRVSGALGSSSLGHDAADDPLIDVILALREDEPVFSQIRPEPGAACFCVTMDYLSRLSTLAQQGVIHWRIRRLFVIEPGVEQSPEEFVQYLTPMAVRKTQICGVWRTPPASSRFENMSVCSDTLRSLLEGMV